MLRWQPRPGGVGWFRTGADARLPAHRNDLHRRRLRCHVPDTSQPARRRARHPQAGETDGQDRRLLGPVYRAGHVRARLHGIRVSARAAVARDCARVALSRGERRRRVGVHAARAFHPGRRGVHAARLHVARRRCHVRHVDLVVQDTRVLPLLFCPHDPPSSSAAQDDCAAVPARAVVSTTREGDRGEGCTRHSFECVASAARHPTTEHTIPEMCEHEPNVHIAGMKNNPFGFIDNV